MTEMYARGLLPRDIDAAFTDATGSRVLTKSPVRQLTETLWTAFEAFRACDLCAFAVESRFLDAVFEPTRRTGQTREGVLAAGGIGRGGPRIRLHLALGNTESADNWLEFLRDLVRRGLCPPTTITSDGVPGLVQVLDDLEASLNHRRAAPAHRKYVRTTHWLERTFEEERCRTQVIPRFWTEHSALTLIFGTLDRASRRWQRLRFSDVEVKHMEHRPLELV